MKASEVIKILRISRPTLTKYVKRGIIKATVLPNGRYDYDADDAILSGQVSTVLIAYKDRLSRVGFELFNHLFHKFGCKIAVVSGVGSTQLDSQEIFEEIVSLLHCYSMKLYPVR